MRVNDPAAAITLLHQGLRALRGNDSVSRRPLLALFSGWDKDLMRCEILKKLMQDPSHASFLRSMRREIVRCICVGGHVRLLEEVIRLLHVKAEDVNASTPGWGWRSRSSPLWIAADNGNMYQVYPIIS